MATQPVEKLLLSTAEAARIIGTSQATVRRWYDEGRLEGEYIGRLLKITRASAYRAAGLSMPGHEEHSGRVELNNAIKEARRLHAELGRILAELEA